MQVRNCMKQNVVSIKTSATIAEAASVIVKRKVGLLPVIDDQDKPIGIIGLRDLLELELPDFVDFIKDVDFVHDFGAVETTRPLPEELTQPVTSLMRDIMTVTEDCGLLRAYAIMLQHKLLDLPVISTGGKLVGIVSHVDIGTAILSSWQSVGLKKS